MRKNIILLALLSLSIITRADVLSDILQGKYKAATLTEQQQDSVLNAQSTQRYRLYYENEQQLFRHSFQANYYIVDTLKGTKKPLADVPARDAIFSPNGKYIAYAIGNKLHLYKLDFGTEVPITLVHEDTPAEQQKAIGEIYEGVTDWLYEEEFGTTSIMAFSPDSKMLAFVRLTETDVPTMQWPVFGTQMPQAREPMLYPENESLRYPKAGTTNAKAELCIYDIATKAIRVMKLPEDEDAYIPRLTWTVGTDQQPAELVALRVNRDQNRMEVFYCNPKSTTSKLWYKEQSKDCYIDFSLFDEWQWLSDNRVLVVSEKSGWKQAYLYSQQGKELKQLTRDGKDVTAVYGIQEKTQMLYFQQADDPETRDLYVLNMKKGTTTKLSNGIGTHSARFSKDMSRYIDCYESTTTPNCYTLYELRGEQSKKIKVLLDNASMQAEWQALRLPEKEWFTFTTERGDVLHGWTLNAHANTKGGATIITQYSGPASQRVLNRWKKTWDYYLAQQGYTVVCVDTRGTDARGRAWRNASYMNLGAVEAEDLISTARHISTWEGIDADRIGIVGWSYGGFQVLTTMSTPSHPFKAGIAIAPVTDWRLYDSAYTERYMRRPQVNEGGYEQSSLLRKANQLTGNLLIVHGLADDNVHAQNTLLYTDALVQAGKQFDEQIYVDDNHFLRRRANYEHLHRRLLRFLSEKL